MLDIRTKPDTDRARLRPDQAGGFRFHAGENRAGGPRCIHLTALSVSSNFFAHGNMTFGPPVPLFPPTKRLTRRPGQPEQGGVDHTAFMPG